MLPIDARNRKWWILSAMGCVLGLILLDETVVGVALPTIQADLGMTQTASHWVVNAYLLFFTSLVAAGGKLGDIVDLEKVFLVGLAIFGLSSLAAGFSQDGPVLIILRAVQGIGAALVFPSAMTMITESFPPEQRGLAFGVQGAVGGTFLALGPLIGGFFTEIFSWRYIFWINPPVAVAIGFMVAAAWEKVPRPGPAPKLDMPGLTTLILGLGALVMGLMQGPVWGWSSAAIVALLIGGASLLLLFVLIELRVSEPLIEVTLFRNATFSASNLVIFMGQYNKLALVVFGALYFQQALQMSPLTAGLALLPGALLLPFSSMLAGRLSDRYGERWLSLSSLLLAGVGFLWIGFAVALDLYWPIVPALVVWGITLPFLYVPPRRTVMNAVPVAKHGQATGINMTAQLMGGTIGVAICGALLVSTGSFSPVFVVPGVLSLVVMVLGWFLIERNT